MNVIKKMLPSSLAAQMILMVLLALLLAQVISLVILGGAYRSVLSDINQQSQLRQVESLVQLLEVSSPAEYSSILAASRSSYAWFTVNQRSEIAFSEMTMREQRLMQRLVRRMGEQYQGRILVSINDTQGRDQKVEQAIALVPGEKKVWQGCRNPDNCDHPWHHHRSTMEGREDAGSTAMMQRKRRGPPKLTSLKISVQMQNNLWLNLQASSPVAPPLAARQTLIFLGLSVVFVLLALGFMVRRINPAIENVIKSLKSARCWRAG